MASAHAHTDQVGAVLRGRAVLSRIGIEAWADRAGNHALAFGVASYRGPELFDDADGLVTDRQAVFHRVFALDDVNVGSADGGGGNPHQGVVGPHVGNGFFTYLDTVLPCKYGGFHLGSHTGLHGGGADGVYVDNQYRMAMGSSGSLFLHAARQLTKVNDPASGG
ncbi:hypothetical protein D3C72_1273070 [compost metagenome]